MSIHGSSLSSSCHITCHMGTHVTVWKCFPNLHFMWWNHLPLLIGSPARPALPSSPRPLLVSGHRVSPELWVHNNFQGQRLKLQEWRVSWLSGDRPLLSLRKAQPLKSFLFNCFCFTASTNSQHPDGLNWKGRLPLDPLPLFFLHCFPCKSLRLRQHCLLTLVLIIWVHHLRQTDLNFKRNMDTE